MNPIKLTRGTLFPYLIIGALLLINVVLLYANDQAALKTRKLVTEAFMFKVESDAVATEERLLQFDHLPDLDPESDAAGPSPFRSVSITGSSSSPFQVDLVAFFSVRNCFDCVQGEIKRLNELLVDENPKIRSIRGFFVDQNPEVVQRHQELLKPHFQMSILPDDGTLLPPDSSLLTLTPSVFVVRTHDRTILDVYQPIPGDSKKRDLFYLKLLRRLDSESTRSLTP